MEKSEKNESEIQERQAKPLGRLLNIIAYPAGAITGWWYATVHINRTAYANLKNHGAIQDKDDYYDKLQEVGKKAIKAVENNEPFDILQYSEPLHNKRHLFSNERLKKVGLDTIGKQWRFMGDFQKQEALLHGVTAGGIVLGALLAASNTKTINELFDRKEKAEAPASDGVQK